MSAIAVTGHRPNRLWGYNLNNEHYDKLKECLKKKLVELDCTVAYTGMALGVDQLFALAVMELKAEGHNIYLHAAVPCLNHPCKWPASSQTLYNKILDACDEVTIVTPEEYKPYLMQVRNEFMVDRADIILAVWNGEKGGTGNCINYANRIGKPVVRLDPNDF